MRRRFALLGTMRTTGRTHRALGRGRLGRREAERLLDARSGLTGLTGETAESGFQDLTRLLEAATGPALTAELSGEDTARAVYSAHYSASATIEENRVFSKALITKAATVKIAAAVFGCSFVGVATAAETGSLPSGMQKSFHSALGSLGVPAPKTSGNGDDQGENQDGTEPSASISVSGSFSAKASASGGAGDQDDQDAWDAAGAAFLGDDGFKLCKAAENGDKDDQGDDLSTAQLQKLAKAAHVPDDVIKKIKSRMDAEKSKAQKQMDDFCNRLAQAEKDLRDGKQPKFPLPPVHPGDGWPTSWPSGLPSLPTKLPSGLPTKLPTGLPTGLPSGIPTSPPENWPSNWPIEMPSDPVHQPSGLPSIPHPSGSASWTFGGSGSVQGH